MVRAPRVGDRRDWSEIDLSGEQALVELGRDAGHLLDVGLQPEEERGHVDVRDASQADHEDAHWKKVTRFPSASSVANSRVPKSVSSTPAFETGCKTSASASSCVQLVHPVGDDPAAGGAGDEGLGPRADGLLARVPLTPAFVAGLPEVDDRLVPAEHGEAAVVVQDHRSRACRDRTRRRGRHR